MGESAGGVSHRPCGFFAIRTPLLPVDAFLAWGEGLAASSAADDSEALSQALASDRVRLRARLLTIISLPEVREALFIASPDFEAAIDAWGRDPESKHGRRVE